MAAIAASAALGLSGTTGAYAAGTLSGSATVIDPATAKPLASGSQSTTWSISLPKDSTGKAAACTGDTATGGYHIYGYVIGTNPPSTEGTTMSFDPINGPSAPALPIFDVTGSQYGPANTAVSTGQIINIPSFNWSRFTSADLPATGNPYHLGISCATGSGVQDRYWNVPITFDAALNWTAQNPPPPSIPESPLTVALPLSAVALLGGGVVVMRRRRSQGVGVVA
jgi:hypothetical protein